MESDKNVPIEHQDVPEAHQGLHSFLYSSDDEHTPTTTATSIPENDGTAVVPLATWRDRSTNAKIAGVYAVIDTQRCTQYVGYSRNVLLSLDSHVSQVGPETCAFVRVQTFKYPKREEMEKLRDEWISALGSVPPGNGEASNLWASTVGEAARSAMSPEERYAYEEKKLKLRRAMADTAMVAELEATSLTRAESPQELKAAVENDDWSAIIDGQTQETKS